MQAAYTLVDEATLDRLVASDPGELGAALEALEADGAPTVYLDKLWDGLHFLLTGATAAAPIEGDPLSEAVVGVHVFEAEDYVGCTEHDELPAVVAALEAVDLPTLLADARFASFAAADVYPRIWSGDAATLRAELAEAFGALLDLHRAAWTAGQHVVVSIL
ncbi:YfbM family protein [Nocardioides carbamazepini]|uniref:YfbM family protein n=1 Tax=Nocardioides carbamazepini TaxID=2854259 RepID=UPI00214A581E|nr:YfbM family protein [Nocardioides carbamazepini]